MKYEITVKAISEHLNENATTYQKVADTGGDDGGPKYGFVPLPGGKLESRTEVLLQQTVSTIDLEAIIRAVNGGLR